MDKERGKVFQVLVKREFKSRDKVFDIFRNIFGETMADDFKSEY